LMSKRPEQPFEALAKIRYNSAAAPAVVTPLADDWVQVEFKEAQPAITPGQVLGIYDQSNTFLLGGAWID
ncbi:MAG TPA: aminomethyltransferase beta-barrel domain-containing protein, partial [Verrucomicrobiae bacterium]|nr:aminomethyltransferase beta-barrel domain-containing protein [Verrucomicrobiae bacterium]